MKVCIATMKPNKPNSGKYCKHRRPAKDCKTCQYYPKKEDEK
jgi:hypothetical protein